MSKKIVATTTAAFTFIATTATVTGGGDGGSGAGAAVAPRRSGRSRWVGSIGNRSSHIRMELILVIIVLFLQYEFILIRTFLIQRYSIGGVCTGIRKNRTRLENQ